MDPKHLAILTENFLWFSPVYDLNDPFEGSVHPDISDTSEEQLKAWVMAQQTSETIRHGAQKAKRGQMETLNRITKAFQSEQTRKAYLKELLDGIAEQNTDVIKTVGVLTFSACNDNILMYSHYSDNHHGYCLQFDINRDPAFAAYAAVIYGSHPRYNWFDPNVSIDEKSDYIFRWKAEDWRYEQEWRVLIDGRFGKVTFPPEMLTGIIFGCRMTEENRDKIRIMTKGRAIQFYEARQKPHSFALDIAMIE